VESFTNNPEAEQPSFMTDSDTSKLVPFLWVQQGNINPANVSGSRCVICDQYKDAVARGNSNRTLHNNMHLNRQHPAAETIMLDWDGTGTDVKFAVCVFRSIHCGGAAPGVVSMSWSTDAIMWQPLWNQTFNFTSRGQPEANTCQWQNVTVGLTDAPNQFSGPRFAFKWLHVDLDADERAYPCSGTLIDDVVLPVQPPSAANMEYGFAQAVSVPSVESCAACSEICPSVPDPIGSGLGRKLRV
jgi:hypothetical protein